MCNTSREVKCLPISVPAILRGNQMHTPQSYLYKLSSLSSLAECQICLQLHFDNVEHIRGKIIENHYICFHVMLIQHENLHILTLYFETHPECIPHQLCTALFIYIMQKMLQIKTYTNFFKLPFYLQNIFFCIFQSSLLSSISVFLFIFEYRT